MGANVSEDGIPRETAVALCTAVRAQYRRRWFTAAHWQCWGCMTFTRGDPDKMCISGKAGYRGCDLVNARYDETEQEEYREV